MRPARSSTLGEAINICELHVKVAKGVDRRDVSNVLLHAVKSGCSSVVEHHVANVRVVSSNLITRSEKKGAPVKDRRPFFYAKGSKSYLVSLMSRIEAKTGK